MVNIQNYLSIRLKQLLQMEGQDLFLKVGCIPRISVSGIVESLPFEPVRETDTAEIAKALLNPTQQALLEKNKSVDFAFSLPGTSQRFRGNVFKQQGMYSIVIRRLWQTIPSFEELHIPPILKKVALERSGIILVGGMVASGKTTTVHAMVNLMNHETKRHIITVEDPVEYLHEDKNCIINQREIGQDAEDFKSALKYVVRQSPHVVVIGEMRDVDSFNFALTASEVGRLVISSIHAKSVGQIFDRILGFFPSEKHGVILNHLSFHITCFVVQKLLVKKDGKTLVPAFEILLGDPMVRNLIAKNEFEKIPQAMRNANQQGMQTMDQALFALWKDGSISQEEALAVSEKPQDLEQNFKGISIDSQNARILGA
ncbi:MAG: PilT/PilU family type 4a pilus ATPase [Candidatus Omnitrophica bacterium]|nr:PilT/PilU family type 4a pilus ATPase [Candidatus Omnitrophota bacterium]